MAKRTIQVAISRPDGGVSIMSVVKDMIPKDADLDAYIATEILRAGVPVVNWKIIKRADLPKDAEFRDAWAFDGVAVKVDMPRARDIHMDRIRRARDAKLRKLDIETMKGVDVQAEKQKLRDLPGTFDLSGAKTPEQLKALWPEELSETA